MEEEVYYNKMSPYEFWNKIGSPKYVCAPMVDQSELPFRILTRKYGVDLAFTPMVHSVMFTTSEKYKEKVLEDLNSHVDSPLFIQLCGHDPDTLLKAALQLEKYCVCIDINLGCPQFIAKRGNYGAFLLEKTELVLKIVKHLSSNLTHAALSCKIRLFKDINKSIQLAKDLELNGCKVLTVHGRTKEQNKEFVGNCNWEAIKAIKSSINIPLIANGGIESFTDVERCFDFTNCDAVMSSEKLLEYPALFSGKMFDLDVLALEYLNIASEFKTEIAFVRAHMFKLMYSACKSNPEFNNSLGEAKNLNDFFELLKIITNYRKNQSFEMKLGWYERYRNQSKNRENQINEKSSDNINNYENFNCSDLF